MSRARVNKLSLKTRGVVVQVPALHEDADESKASIQYSQWHSELWETSPAGLLLQPASKFSEGCWKTPTLESNRSFTCMRNITHFHYCSLHILQPSALTFPPCHLEVSRQTLMPSCTRAFSLSLPPSLSLFECNHFGRNITRLRNSNGRYAWEGEAYEQERFGPNFSLALNH